MDRQLSLGQYLIITVIVLLINNLALWYFLGSDSKEMANVQADIVKTPSSITESTKPHNIDIKQARNNQLLAISPDQEEEQLQEQEIFEESTEVTSAVKSYMASDEFFEVLDTYRTQRQQQQRELQKEVASLSTLELLNAFSTTTERQEKGIILQALYQRDLVAIDAYQLKEFYNDEDVNGWMKSKLLVAMLDQKDQEAVSLAKEFVSVARRQEASYEIWNRLFDLDRDYVVQTASDMSISELAKGGSIVSSISQDTDAVKVFFENQLDNILNAGDSRVFQNLQHYQVEMELSGSQQRSLGDLLGSERQSERNFALAFVGSIEDTGMLKDRYNDLNSSQEKQNFVYKLISNAESEAHTQLAREIIEASDDSAIKKLKDSF